MIMKLKVLVLAEINRIDEEFDSIEFDYLGGSVPPYTPLPYDVLKEIVGRYQVIISEFDTIDKEIIDQAVNLKLIICCRGGVGTVVDVDYARKKRILIKNTPGRNACAVAEYVLGIILNHDRSLSECNSSILTNELQKQCFCKTVNYKDSLWGMDEKSPYHIYRGKGLHNILLGIVGYGHTGKAVTKMAVAMGIKVLLCSHHATEKDLPDGVEIVSMDDLLKRSDYVSLHCIKTDNKVVIGREELVAMKPSAYLINAARWDVLDEEALIEALDQHIISGAALDVTQHEPLLPDDKIIKAENIFITPHIAGATDEVIDHCTDMVKGYLRVFLEQNNYLLRNRNDNK